MRNNLSLKKVYFHFYAILPLALIEAVYKEKGYSVRWNAIDDVNDDEDTKVDDHNHTTSA